MTTSPDVASSSRRDFTPAPPVPLPRATGSTRPRLQDEWEYRSRWEHGAFYAFVIVPFLALVAGVTVAGLRHGLDTLTVVLFVVFYVVPLHGVTVGYHRLFTHRSFKANLHIRCFPTMALLSTGRSATSRVVEVLATS